MIFSLLSTILSSAASLVLYISDSVMTHTIDYIYRTAMHTVNSTLLSFIELVVKLTINIYNNTINSTINNIRELINNYSEASFGIFNSSLHCIIEFTVESNISINNRTILLYIYYNICYYIF